VSEQLEQALAEMIKQEQLARLGGSEPEPAMPPTRLSDVGRIGHLLRERATLAAIGVPAYWVIVVEHDLVRRVTFIGAGCNACGSEAQSTMDDVELYEAATAQAALLSKIRQTVGALARACGDARAPDGAPCNGEVVTAPR
jgi:hypothetical protein